MTPEQEVDRARMGTWTTLEKIYWRGDLIEENEHVVTAPLSYERELRPASISNPLRIDGSRALSAWEHRWANSRRFIGASKTVVSNGRYPEERVTESPYVIPFNMDPDRFALRADVPFVRTMSPWDFPYDVETLARQRTILKLMDQKAQWGAMLGEAAETARGVKAAATGFIDLLNDIHRIKGLNPAAARRVLQRFRATRPVDVERYLNSLPKLDKAVANKYLAFQFGLKPLLYDINDSATVLDEMVNGAEPYPATYTVASGAQASDVAPVEVEIITPYGPATFEVPVWRRTRCRISCVYEVDVNRGLTYQQMGLTNSFSVGWEILPFSWAVDYVFGVGGWLSSLFPVDGASFVEGSITRMQEAETVGPCSLKETDVVFKSGPPYALEYKVGRISRSLMLTLLPGTRPAFRHSLGISQLANLSAVFTQLFRR